jgi:hypothetical protein
VTTLNTKTPFRKTGIDKPTPDNLEKVIAQLRQVILELQGAVGPPGLRAVRVEELVQIGLVRVTPNGLSLGGAITGAVPIPPIPPVGDGAYDSLIDYDDAVTSFDGV